MRVVETHDIDEDGQGTLSIEVETESGECSVSLMAQEPEDNTFYRDLNSAYSIAELLKLAYEAGKRGELYEYEFIDENPEEEAV